MKFVSLTLLSIFSLSRGLFANPQNPTVVSGTASFDQTSPSTLNITASDCAIINWEDFSIDAGELTKFIQPAHDARVLSRVTGGNPSAIFGTLEANGMLYLINPNGLVVGSGGEINTASFIASTLDVLDADFIQKGDLHFTGAPTASVTNLGSIDGWNGDVFLIGHHVDNHGAINTPAGTAGLAAGVDVILLASGEERLMIQPTTATPDGTGVVNAGTIEAISAELKADGNLFALAINHTGEIDATGLDARDGRIFLVAEGGSVSVGGALYAANDNNTGGEIRVLGTTLEVTDNADIDVSGDFGGGLIYVGGNIPNEEPVLYRATTTTVSTEAGLDASALGAGNGGTITVIAAGTTSFAAGAFATGGEIAGNGGRVNVGGLQNLEFTGSADTTADYGMTGLLGTGTPTLTVKALGEGESSLNIMDTGLLSSNLENNNCAVVAFSEGLEPTLLTVEDPVSWNSPNWLLYRSDDTLVMHAGGSNPSSSGDGLMSVQSLGSITVEAADTGIEFQFPGSSIGMDAVGALAISGGSATGSSIVMNGQHILLRGDDVSLQGGSADDTFIMINASSNCQIDVYGSLTMQGGTGQNTDVTVPNNASIAIHGSN